MLPSSKRIFIGFVNWLYRWLPRFMGCHCRIDRSFIWRNGLPFPVCARCTGELIGMVIAFCTGWVYHPPIWFLLVLLVPMIVDGTLQLLKLYESNNWRRLITGMLFGYGFTVLIALSFLIAYRFGLQVGKQIPSLF